MRRFARPARAGLSLIEVVISTLLVGLVVVGALNSVGAVIRGRMHTGDAGKARHLAVLLMCEILPKAYEDSDGLSLLGVDLPEDPNVRSGFDDVDDYHNWSSSPPTDVNGNPLPGYVGWERSVVVEWVSLEDPATTVMSGQGVKRITVTVKRNGVVLAQLTALRTRDS